MIDTLPSEQGLAHTPKDIAAAHALNTAGRAIGDAVDSVAPALQQAAQKLGEVAHQGLASVREGSGDLRAQARWASRATADYIRQEPVKSVLIAAAVGAGIMALYSLVRHVPDAAGR